MDPPEKLEPPEPEPKSIAPLTGKLQLTRTKNPQKTYIWVNLWLIEGDPMLEGWREGRKEGRRSGLTATKLQSERY